MTVFNTGLPVESVLGDLEQALNNHRNAILSAAPGAGKSTLVPPALMDAEFLSGKKILMLEPRRIAASGAARRIAFLLGEKPGERAGYRTRFGSAVSAATRIEVITEGILTRMIQDDPELNGVGLVIFDEFHERSIHADLGLALALDVQNALREDLRILVMSATLDTDRIGKLLGPDTTIITSEGKVYPVETEYMPPDDRDRPLEKLIVPAVVHALNSHPGDLLVFLPGEGEIRRGITELEQTFPDAADQKLLFVPLFGNLPEKEQDRALEPAPEGFRKIILSTSVAESSVTVPGVRIVIDTGWRRVPRFSPSTAMSKLETVRVPLSSADQRRGRAGRTAPGFCIRLWNRSEELNFAPFAAPEILETDLAPLSLELAQWGLTPDTAGTLRWLDPPPQAKLLQAFDLLHSLGAVGRDNRITPHGKTLLKRPMHPRLAHMISRAEEFRVRELGCAVAAVLSERDFLPDLPHSDLNERLEFLLPEKQETSWRVNRGTLQRVRAAYRQLTSKDFTRDQMRKYSGILPALAYPDRIARTRSPHSGEYTLSNGIAAKLRPDDDMRQYEFLCTPVVEGAGNVPTVFMSASLTLDELKKYFSALLADTVTAQWNNGSLTVWRELRLGSIALERRQLPADSPELDPELRTKVFLDGIRKQTLPWSEHEISCLKRMNFLHRVLGEDWPDCSDEHLAATMEEWLGPFLTSKNTTLESLRGNTLAAAFQNLAGPRLLQLEKFAPERLEVPSGSKIRIDYSHDPPLLPVRLQEVFGMLTTPMLAGGRVPLVMNLLSPAMRTVQITSDLAHFWAESYFLVRKEMRGRYPKHDWPENPLEALPHRGSLKRKKES